MLLVVTGLFWHVQESCWSPGWAKLTAGLLTTVVFTLSLIQTSLPLSCCGSLGSAVAVPTLVVSLQMVLGGGQLFQSQQDLLHRTSPLLLSYYLIQWASQCLASDVPVDTL